MVVVCAGHARSPRRRRRCRDRRRSTAGTVGAAVARSEAASSARSSSTTPVTVANQGGARRGASEVDLCDAIAMPTATATPISDQHAYARDDRRLALRGALVRIAECVSTVVDLRDRRSSGSRSRGRAPRASSIASCASDSTHVADLGRRRERRRLLDRERHLARGREARPSASRASARMQIASSAARQRRATTVARRASPRRSRIFDITRASRRAREETLARERLPEHDARREDVRAPVDRVARGAARAPCTRACP